jgi:hypothetical protein
LPFRLRTPGSALRPRPRAATHRTSWQLRPPVSRAASLPDGGATAPPRARPLFEPLRAGDCPAVQIAVAGVIKRVLNRCSFA